MCFSPPRVVCPPAATVHRAPLTGGVQLRSAAGSSMCGEARVSLFSVRAARVVRRWPFLSSLPSRTRSLFVQCPVGPRKAGHKEGPIRVSRACFPGRVLRRARRD